MLSNVFFKLLFEFRSFFLNLHTKLEAYLIVEKEQKCLWNVWCSYNKWYLKQYLSNSLLLNYYKNFRIWVQFKSEDFKFSDFYNLNDLATRYAYICCQRVKVLKQMDLKSFVFNSCIMKKS